MAECQICKHTQASLKFKTKHISICTDCVNDLNECSQPAYAAQGRIGDLLRKGMARRNPNYTEEQYRRARPGWFNRLLANKKNKSRDFRILRAARRGLLRETGVTPWEYPSDWKERAQRIRGRDKCSCQFCGATNFQLDVHHIIYLSNWGTNQQSNLITLCRPCHETEHEREFDFGEPDEPGNPRPIRPKRGRTTNVKKPKKPEPLEPIESSILDEMLRDHSHAPSPKSAIEHVIPPQLLPTDLWCPKCATSLTAKLTTAVLESQKVRCPTCKLIFTASEGLESRLTKPIWRKPEPAAPAQSTSSPHIWVKENSAEDEVTVTTTSRRFEQSPSPSQKSDSVLRWDLAVFTLICLSLIFLTIATGEHDASPAQALPAPEKTIDVQIQETMSEAMRAYPYLNTEQGLEATREIISVRNQLLAQGVLPVTALRLAIYQVAPKHDPKQAKP